MLSAAGVALGLFGGFSVWFFSQLTAAVVAVVLLVTHKAGKKDGLPFAPFLVIGFLIVLAYGGV
jgi:leader peptidase (prepilin peptidase)/N-methyltransferase